jgi:hypothetical protein
VTHPTPPVELPTDVPLSGVRIGNNASAIHSSGRKEFQIGDILVVTIQRGELAEMVTLLVSSVSFSEHFHFMVIFSTSGHDVCKNQAC